MPNTLLIAQISDTHITRRGEKAYGIASTVSNLENSISSINLLVPRPDLVLVTGDITNNNQIEEYELAETLLSQLDMPYFVIPGNHDDRKTLKTTFKKHCPVEPEQTYIQYVLENHELRLIAMDSTIHIKSGGELCPTRLSWLDEQLSKDTDKPTVIFMHHPPVKVGVIEADIEGFIGAEEFGEIIEKYNNIERIICGHVHLQTHTRWHGTIVTTAPSISMAIVLDLTLTKQPQFMNEPPSYLLHYWTRYKNLVTHTVDVRETDGPYFFD